LTINQSINQSIHPSIHPSIHQSYILYDDEMLPPPDSTRLVTIIAHVDHGKTTLADNLIESNGIISERLAGTLRYLDSDPEEQRRGITMRASAIGLRHSYVPPKPRGGGGGGGTGTGTSSSPSPSPSSQQSDNDGSGNASSAAIHRHRDMVVHLIDSPGHVDFSAEVTSSLLLCDSAILVVDAVEGLCARTHSLVREAYLHRLVPILVINKVDRLCAEMGLDAAEAYVRMRGLVETVNAACASMLNSAVAADDADGGGGGGDDTAGAEDGGGGGDVVDDDDGGAIAAAAARDADACAWDFDPAKGNVVFASALHGWGFTVPALARSLFRSGTVPLKPQLMRRYLFGDTKYNAETGKVLKWKHQGARGVRAWAAVGGIRGRVARGRFGGAEERAIRRRRGLPRNDDRRWDRTQQQKEDGARQDRGYHSRNGTGGIRPAGGEHVPLRHFATAGD
jgi:ribosome assembly protein 1